LHSANTLGFDQLEQGACPMIGINYPQQYPLHAPFPQSVHAKLLEPVVVIWVCFQVRLRKCGLLDGVARERCRAKDRSACRAQWSVRPSLLHKWYQWSAVRFAKGSDHCNSPELSVALLGDWRLIPLTWNLTGMESSGKGVFLFHLFHPCRRRYLPSRWASPPKC
jgi:hypothetical protein